MNFKTVKALFMKLTTNIKYNEMNHDVQRGTVIESCNTYFRLGTYGINAVNSSIKAGLY